MKRRIRLHHPERLAEVIREINFINGVEEKKDRRLIFP
jgi:hypothetical protein